MRDNDSKLLAEAYSQVDEGRRGNWHTERMRRDRRAIGKVKQSEAEERAKQIRFSFDGPNSQQIEQITKEAFKDEPIRINNGVIVLEGEKPKKIGVYGTGLQRKGYSTWEAFVILSKDMPDLIEKFRNFAGDRIKGES